MTVLFSFESNFLYLFYIKDEVNISKFESQIFWNSVEYSLILFSLNISLFLDSENRIVELRSFSIHLFNALQKILERFYLKFVSLFCRFLVLKNLFFGLLFSLKFAQIKIYIQVNLLQCINTLEIDHQCIRVCTFSLPSGELHAKNNLACNPHLSSFFL